VNVYKTETERLKCERDQARQEVDKLRLVKGVKTTVTEQNQQERKSKEGETLNQLPTSCIANLVSASSSSKDTPASVETKTEETSDQNKEMSSEQTERPKKAVTTQSFTETNRDNHNTNSMHGPITGAPVPPSES